MVDNIMLQDLVKKYLEDKKYELKGEEGKYANNADLLPEDISKWFNSVNIKSRRLLHLSLLFSLNSNWKSDYIIHGSPLKEYSFYEVSGANETLYFSALRDLNMEQFLRETILFCPLTLLEEIMDFFISKLKLFRNRSFWNVKYWLLISLFEKISYYCLLCKEEDLDTLRNIFTSYHVFLNTESDSENEEANFDGYWFLGILRSLKSFGKCFTNSWYEWVMKVDSFYGNPEKDEERKIIKFAYATHCYELVALKCKSFVENLDIEVFIEWHETEFDGYESLQAAIVGEVKSLLLLLKNKEISPNLPFVMKDVCAMLRAILSERPNDSENQSADVVLDFQYDEERELTI